MEQDPNVKKNWHKIKLKHKPLHQYFCISGPIKTLIFSELTGYLHLSSVRLGYLPRVMCTTCTLIENKCTFSGYPDGKMFLSWCHNNILVKLHSFFTLFESKYNVMFWLIFSKIGLQNAAISFDFIVRAALIWWGDLSVHVRLCTDINEICTQKCSWHPFPKR